MGVLVLVGVGLGQRLGLSPARRDAEQTPAARAEDDLVVSPPARAVDVAGGFGLYLNRRTELEAWDIEITFRRMARRYLELGKQVPG